MSTRRRPFVSAIASALCIGMLLAGCRPTSSSTDEVAPSIKGPGFSSFDCDVQVRPGDELATIVNGSDDDVFCIHAGTYDIGTSNLEGRTGLHLVGAPATRNEMGAIDAPTKIVGNSTDGVILFEEHARDVLLVNLDISGAEGSKDDDDPETKKHGRGINGNSQEPVITILFSRIHHNANSGIDGIGEGSLLQTIELDRNGSDSFLGCCAGGVKSANPYTIRNSYVHDNIGFGVWQDVCGSGFVVTGNRISSNSQGGVRYEHDQSCDGDATIVDNVITDNNTSSKSSDAGGITINSAPNAEVRGNVLDGNNGPGITVGGNRGSVGGTVIEGNTMNGESIQGCDQEGVSCADNPSSD
jgi:hypothetical protein